MSLTLGHGPLAAEPAGERNYRIEGPAHRIWFEPSPRRVRGVLGGETVVDGRGAHLLHETGLLPVYYFPRQDVRMDLLRPSEKTTRCPYEGEASYHSVAVDGARHEDLIWTYGEPTRAVEPIRGRLAFFSEKVALEVDGEPQERPRTQWP